MQISYTFILSFLLHQIFINKAFIKSCINDKFKKRTSLCVPRTRFLRVFRKERLCKLALYTVYKEIIERNVKIKLKSLEKK